MSRSLTVMPPRRLVALTLALLICLGAALYGVGPAHAGTNSRVGNCIDSYNYADPSNDYLYASTSGKQAYPEPCAWVRVWIYQGGCGGTELSYKSGGHFVATSTTMPRLYWVDPCSRHVGEGYIETHSLPFVY